MNLKHSTALKFNFDVTYIGFNPILTNKNKYRDLKKSFEEKSKRFKDECHDFTLLMRNDLVNNDDLLNKSKEQLRLLSLYGCIHHLII